MKILVTAANGKMGQAILKEAINEGPIKYQKVIGIVRPKSLSTNLNHIKNEQLEGIYTNDIDVYMPQIDVVIDFSSPKYSIEIAKKCLDHQKILICGTTGFSEIEHRALSELAKKSYIFHAPNMSIMISLMKQLLQKAVAALDNTFDIEMIEKHHRSKIDTPSGTSLMLANAIKETRFNKFGNEQFIKVGRHSNGSRTNEEIGIAAVRCGNLIGEHEVLIAGEHEILSLKHTASSRVIYASGALKAAHYMTQVKEKRLYSMDDLINFYSADSTSISKSI